MPPRAVRRYWRLSLPGQPLEPARQYDWAARYAKTVLDTVPPGAIVFARKDADISALAYFHLVEGVRPDIQLYQPNGLVLGNRLFHPLRTTQEEMDAKLTEFIAHAAAPVMFVGDFFTGNARHDRWLHTQVDRSSRDPAQATIKSRSRRCAFSSNRFSTSRRATPGSRITRTSCGAAMQCCSGSA